MLFSKNDLYPFYNATQTTTGETIPEEVERQHYKDSTVVSSEGKTSMVDFKMLFVAIAGFVGVAYLLNKLD
jgi:hypothetical protein